jgi:hypothetical protein
MHTSEPKVERARVKSAREDRLAARPLAGGGGRGLCSARGRGDAPLPPPWLLHCGAERDAGGSTMASGGIGNDR